MRPTRQSGQQGALTQAAPTPAISTLAAGHIPYERRCQLMAPKPRLPQGSPVTIWEQGSAFP